MKIINWIKKLFQKQKVEKVEEKHIIQKIDIEIDSIWNYLDLVQNTQAYYLIEAINFEEWEGMDEIREKIKSYYGAEFKNQKSLYPYLKTLVDIGLIETSNIDGKKKWKKKEILIKTAKKKEEVEEIEAKST